MDIQLTRRGQLVAAFTVGIVLMSAIFGARSFNAIVAPGVVALGAAVLLVHRANAPTVAREVPAAGHAGETHAVGLDVSECSAGNYELSDAVGKGFSAAVETFHVTERNRSLRYEVTYERRGVHEFGSASATVTDVLGLVQRRFRIDAGDDQVLVYPELVAPSGAVRSLLETVVDAEHRPGRDEFDSLREYVRGDSLRDVHWNSSAKRPNDDLVVKEFVGRTPTDAVRIGVAARGSRSSADAAARATASVATTLLEEGVEVGVETPRETIEPGIGPVQRDAILRALARLGTGSATADESTIRITATDGEAVVHAGGRSVAFSGSGDRTDGSHATDTAATARRDGAAEDGDEAGVVP